MMVNIRLKLEVSKYLDVMLAVISTTVNVAQYLRVVRKLRSFQKICC